MTGGDGEGRLSGGIAISGRNFNRGQEDSDLAGIVAFCTVTGARKSNVRRRHPDRHFALCHRPCSQGRRSATTEECCSIWAGRVQLAVGGSPAAAGWRRVAARRGRVYAGYGWWEDAWTCPLLSKRSLWFDERRAPPLLLSV